MQIAQGLLALSNRPVFKSCFPHHRTLDFSRVLLLFGGLPPQPHPNGPDIGVGLYTMGHG